MALYMPSDTVNHKGKSMLLCIYSIYDYDVIIRNGVPLNCSTCNFTHQSK